jgi:hypothetical protein
MQLDQGAGRGQLRRVLLPQGSHERIRTRNKPRMMSSDGRGGASVTARPSMTSTSAASPVTDTRTTNETPWPPRGSPGRNTTRSR